MRFELVVQVLEVFVEQRVLLRELRVRATQAPDLVVALLEHVPSRLEIARHSALLLLHRPRQIHLALLPAVLALQYIK